MLLCICTDFQVDRAIHGRDLRPPRKLSSQNSPGTLGLWLHAPHGTGNERDLSFEIACLKAARIMSCLCYAQSDTEILTAGIHALFSYFSHYVRSSMMTSTNMWMTNCRKHLFHPYNYFQKQWKLLLEQSTGRGSELKWCGHFQRTLFTSDSRTHAQARENRWFARFGMSYVTRSQLMGRCQACIPVVCSIALCAFTYNTLDAPKLAWRLITYVTNSQIIGSWLVYIIICQDFHIFGKVRCQQCSLIWLPQHHLSIFYRPEKRLGKKISPILVPYM